jgi:para-aminobenzoate synthetase
VVDEGAILPEVEEAVRNFGPSRTLSISNEKAKPYFVRSVSLGRRGLSAQDTFDHFIRGSTLDGEAWLDSAKVRDVHSRNSYLAPAAFSLSYSTETRTLSFFQQGKSLDQQCLNESYWNWLDRFHKEVIQDNTEALSAQALDQEAEVGQPILQVGLIGYLGYELKRESLPGYTFARSSTPKESSQSDTQLLFADTVLWLDNYTREWKAIGLIRRDEDDPIGQAIGSNVPVGKTEAQFDAFVSEIKEAFARPPSPPRLDPVALPSFTGLDNESSYSKLVEACRASIKEGEYYEATLTTRFHGQSEADSYSLYLYLRDRNPAPYSAYINFPSHDFQLLSSSPERFISIDRDNVAEMKPIKGTVKRSLDPDEDALRARALQNDKKELAENLMVGLAFHCLT